VWSSTIAMAASIGHPAAACCEGPNECKTTVRDRIHGFGRRMRRHNAAGGAVARLIWIKARAGEKDQVARGCGMHDVLGSAGMLRGWVTIWTQMAWLLASLTMSIGAVAVFELCVTARARRGGRPGKPLT
jgi:hypothetical protein